MPRNWLKLRRKKNFGKNKGGVSIQPENAVGCNKWREIFQVADPTMTENHSLKKVVSLPLERVGMKVLWNHTQPSVRVHFHYIASLEQITSGGTSSPTIPYLCNCVDNGAELGYVIWWISGGIYHGSQQCVQLHCSNNILSGWSLMELLFVAVEWKHFMQIYSKWSCSLLTQTIVKLKQAEFGSEIIITKEFGLQTMEWFIVHLTDFLTFPFLSYSLNINI